MKKKKKLGFALGAGGSRGVAHIGFLQAMEEADIKPDYIAELTIGANPDNLHFNTEALREFGRRYFAAYLRDHPEMIKSEEISAEDEYTEAKLEEMKKKLADGKISQNEYDDFFSKYIQTL